MGIDKPSKAYSLLKGYVDFCFRNFYKVTFLRQETMNPNTRAIFAPNHQNALMDPLAVLSAFKWQPVFLARSDIFANKTVAKILRFLKLLPVYRIRDGFDQLAHNAESFRQTFDVLDNNHPLTILPEGNHEGKKRLRTLKKGFARIAFSYRHENRNKNDISIIPVGLNYFNYHKPGSPLLIRFGNPIPVSAFDAHFRESPAIATNALLKTLGEELRRNMLHISEDADYDVIDTYVSMYASMALQQKMGLPEIFDRQKEIIEQLESMEKEEPAQFSKVKDATGRILELLQSQRLAVDDAGLAFMKDNNLKIFSGFVLLILSFPLYAFAWIQNLIPTLVLHNLLAKFKDPHFKSSVLLVGTIFLFPVFHGLQTLAFWLISGSWQWSLLYLASLPLSFVWKYYWQSWFSNLQKRRRLFPIKGKVKRMVEELVLL
ncbi:MAG: hypothetical protein EA361_03405 [Bacteroidetes bacterium]|nr:MAG: hypothetical protein EA361_03405 [Bacteroidota bacterium]